MARIFYSDMLWYSVTAEKAVGEQVHYHWSWLLHSIECNKSLLSCYVAFRLGNRWYGKVDAHVYLRSIWSMSMRWRTWTESKLCVWERRRHHGVPVELCRRQRLHGTRPDWQRTHHRYKLVMAHSQWWTQRLQSWERRLMWTRSTERSYVSRRRTIRHWRSERRVAQSLSRTTVAVMDTLRYQPGNVRLRRTTVNHLLMSSWRKRRRKDLSQMVWS